MAVIVCAGCGKKANALWSVCPKCGANPATGEGFQEEKKPAIPNLSKSSLSYAVAGFPALLLPVLGIWIATVLWAGGAMFGYQSWRAHRKRSALVGFIVSMAGLILSWTFVIWAGSGI